MSSLVIVFWRDIPAQILVRAGRRRERRPLPERFEQAIDRAAMRSGARDSDAYLAEWRRSAPVEQDGDPAAVADAALARILAEYPPERLQRLARQGGVEAAGGEAGP